MQYHYPHTDGLLVHLTFNQQVDGVVPDVASNMWNATLNNGARVENGYLRLSGGPTGSVATNPYATLPNGLLLQLNTYTISLYLRIYKVVSNQQILVFSQDTSNCIAMYFDTVGSTPNFRALLAGV